ncbi:hypothetical protein CLAIMM_04889 isoform 2 [Cladophialophora immunda]|nr:hypothetical protein CLAIMM_04889 isoform 1 [Cladophialophora immunda]OQU99225.1 hypothetical protein CLAIMM_04889 isoform 2 [Cladophialophora immunda]
MERNHLTQPRQPLPSMLPTQTIGQFTWSVTGDLQKQRSHDGGTPEREGGHAHLDSTGSGIPMQGGTRLNESIPTFGHELAPAELSTFASVEALTRHLCMIVFCSDSIVRPDMAKKQIQSAPAGGALSTVGEP